MAAGTLYLIPSLLGDTEPSRVLPEYNKEIIQTISHYIVENEKSARHFLKKAGLQRPISEITLYLLDGHTTQAEYSGYLKPALEGENMGIISEAGCPAIADPGSVIVEMAHKKSISVVPLVGPSSILLALMGSGFNGQSFIFHGYLPRERADRIKKIKEIERASLKKQTQMFIETPYRNKHMMDDLIEQCDVLTRLCVAVDLTLPTESIQTNTIAQWKKRANFGDQINKRPAIFLLQA